MVYHGLNHQPIQEPVQNDVFWSAPEQIYALRKALKWSKRDLGAFLGLYLDWVGKGCYTVHRWETGKFKPLPVYRRRMTTLVSLYRSDYLRELRKLEPGPKVHKLIEVRRKVTFLRYGYKRCVRYKNVLKWTKPGDPDYAKPAAKVRPDGRRSALPPRNPEGSRRAEPAAAPPGRRVRS